MLRRCVAGLLLLALPSLLLAEEKRYALLVGVNAYKNRKLENLQFAERDAAEMADVLKAGGYEVAVLLGSADGDKKATRANFDRLLAATLQRLSKEDLLVVGLAGHGVQFKPEGGTRDEAFFCPFDAELGDAATMVSLSKLLKDLDDKGGKANLLLVDACRNDPNPNRGRGIDGSRVEGLGEGTAILLSCSRGQRAFESKDAGGGHGVFFHCVLEGLKGGAKNDRGDVTWDRLTTFVKERMEAVFPKLVPEVPVAQRPHKMENLAFTPVLLSVRTKGAKDLILGKWRHTSVVGQEIQVEFQASGSMRFQVATAGSPELTGTYRLPGEDTIEVKIEFMGVEKTQKMKIKQLDDKTLVTIDEQDKEEKFERIK